MVKEANRKMRSNVFCSRCCWDVVLITAMILHMLVSPVVAAGRRAEHESRDYKTHRTIRGHQQQQQKQQQQQQQSPDRQRELKGAKIPTFDGRDDNDLISDGSTKKSSSSSLSNSSKSSSSSKASSSDRLRDDCPDGEFPYLYRLIVSPDAAGYQARVDKSGQAVAVASATGTRGGPDVVFSGCLPTYTSDPNVRSSYGFSFELSPGDTLENNLIEFQFEVGEDNDEQKTRDRARHRQRQRQRQRYLKEDKDDSKKTSSKGSDSRKSATMATDIVRFVGGDFVDGSAASSTIIPRFQGTFVEGTIVQAFGNDATGAPIVEQEVSNFPSTAPGVSSSPPPAVTESSKSTRSSSSKAKSSATKASSSSSSSSSDGLLSTTTTTASTVTIVPPTGDDSKKDGKKEKKDRRRRQLQR